MARISKRIRRSKSLIKGGTSGRIVFSLFFLVSSRITFNSLNSSRISLIVTSSSISVHAISIFGSTLSSLMTAHCAPLFFNSVSISLAGWSSFFFKKQEQRRRRFLRPFYTNRTKHDRLFFVSFLLTIYEKIHLLSLFLSRLQSVKIRKHARKGIVDCLGAYEL